MISGELAANAVEKTRFAGTYLGDLKFLGEEDVPMETPWRGGLDGRLYTDLARLKMNQFVVPTNRFYVRTAASQWVCSTEAASIQTHGSSSVAELSLSRLLEEEEPQGLHLMECAGNRSRGHFGLMSVAEWSGVAMSTVLHRLQLNDPRKLVLVAGFDGYTRTSLSSICGASWIFRYEHLHDSGAFLALSMNSKPLAPDHGAPARLVLPNWYGCACIKWVNAIMAIDEGAETTTQMKEYSSRTHQNGVPELARDYEPAVIDPAAMPIRIEQWMVNGKISYRVVGLLWGQINGVESLEIRFTPGGDYVPIEKLGPAAGNAWRFWTHFWRPKERGIHEVRVRVPDPLIRTRRLDAGYYVRKVNVEGACD